MRAVALILLSACITLPLYAQSARPDSSAEVVVRQGTAPAGVGAVRQRIRSLRGQRTRVVQPIIVVVPQPVLQAAPQPVAARPATPAAALPAPLTPAERQALDTVRPGLGNRIQQFYDAYRPSDVVVTVPGGRDYRDSPPVTPPTVIDTTAAPVAEGEGEIVPPPRPTTVQPMPRVTPPSVREVERAILETGLFRAAGVNFEFDKSVLLEGVEVLLDPVGEVLRQYPDLQIEVGGHTDSIGSDAYNRQLSQARAETVRQYLINTFGLDPDRLVARGYGEELPLVTNANPTGRALNRRVEFRVLD